MMAFITMLLMSDLEYIFPQDLKMWAKSAGRKFLDAQEKINGLSTKNISTSAYWDKDGNIAILTEEGTIYTYGKTK